MKQIETYSFHTGTLGFKDHKVFIEWVNKNQIRIINSFITYHKYSDSHKPEYIHYVIEYDTKQEKMKHRATLTTDTGNKITVLADKKSMNRLQREATAKGWTLEIDQSYNQEFNQNQSI